MFTAASTATMAVCILIFGIFYSILMNVNQLIRTLEEEVGITVLFDEGTTQDKIDRIGEQIKSRPEVTELTFVSAEEAWEAFGQDYFKEHPEYAQSFAADNPLANSASYTVQVDEIEHQDSVVAFISALDGVRQVNQSSGATKTLISFNRLFTYISIGIIVLLLVIAIFLISNTVSMGIAVRKREISIMKVIGATDSFVRAPFIVEGILIGAVGAAIPLLILYGVYDRLIGLLLDRFGILQTVSTALPDVHAIFEGLLPVSLALGLGVGLIGSIITVRRQLRSV